MSSEEQPSSNPKETAPIQQHPKRPIRRHLTAAEREKLEEMRAPLWEKILRKNIATIGFAFIIFFYTCLKPILENIIPEGNNVRLFNKFKPGDLLKYRIFMSTYKDLKLDRPNSYRFIYESPEFNYSLKHFTQHLGDLNYTVTINPKILSNKTERYWVVEVSPVDCNFQEGPVNGKDCVKSYHVAPIIRWETPAKKEGRKLLDFNRKKEPEVKQEDDIYSNTTLRPFTYPNNTFDIVFIKDYIRISDIAYHNYKHIRASEQFQILIPPTTENYYLHIPNSRLWLNESETKDIEYHLSFQLKSFFAWDYPLDQEVGQDNKVLLKVWTDIKTAHIENPAWFFWGYIFLAVTRNIVKLITFKEEFDFWIDVKNVRGISVHTVVFDLFTDIVVMLYLYDQHSNMLDVILKGFSILLSLFKVFKLLTPIMDWPYFKWNGGEDDPDTLTFDNEVGKYINKGLIPLFIGTLIYQLIFSEFKSWMSFIIQGFFSFVSLFGFVRLFPQLYINYKLKSVAGISFTVLVYKCIGTFIDDLYAILMNLPTLYKITCFRDDITFFIWVFQCCIYKIDNTRSNEYGEILAKLKEEEEDEAEEEMKKIKKEVKIEDIDDSEDDELQMRTQKEKKDNF
ncbi:hypothetical protein TVAG_515920 [Trichomonas vaginalis G3]|uniref:Uncharacterized protein n=1 Tax=Trichomonas vaginalis (strain ATCC PRA-98 / G3) TaxID=412133 RepID=A2GEV7_TRIV3|nr:apoptotic process [Trichomonas vaginalis G3]EAX84311.1 hypothetical protein TVAG_515920 [Trichomonas vaginalis G3]KAI5541992.1 apoptotic process [Trichomonas vaginalis G3]|eukprot:XP_001297241.1 hypothetical protein [Trichomonas vaginalis G3]